MVSFVSSLSIAPTSGYLARCAMQHESFIHMLNEVFAVNMMQQDDFKLPGSNIEHVSHETGNPGPSKC